MKRPIHIWLYNRHDFGGRVACGKPLRMSDGRVGEDIWARGLDAGRGCMWCPDCVKAMAVVAPEGGAK